MMTIIDKLDRVATRNKQCKSKQNNKENAEKIKQSHLAFLENFDKLSFQVKILNSVRKSFTDFKISEDLSQNLGRCYDICEKTFENNNCFDLGFVYEVGQFINKISNEWSTYISDKSSVFIRKLSVLKTISENQNDIDKIIGGLRCFSVWPMDDAKINNFLSFKESAKNIIDSSDLKPEIEQFLTKLSTNNATFFDLSNEIVAWIKEHNLEKKIGLSITL